MAGGTLKTEFLRLRLGSQRTRKTVAVFQTKILIPTFATALHFQLQRGKLGGAGYLNTTCDCDFAPLPLWLAAIHLQIYSVCSALTASHSHPSPRRSLCLPNRVIPFGSSTQQHQYRVWHTTEAGTLTARSTWGICKTIASSQTSRAHSANLAL